MSIIYHDINNKIREVSIDTFINNNNDFALTIKRIQIKNFSGFFDFSPYINCEYLDLSGNKLSVLPETIKFLTNLQDLDLTDNMFTTLDNNILYLQNLRRVVLRLNNFSDLPIILNKLPNIEEVIMGKFSDNKWNTHEELTEEWKNIATLKIRNCADSDLPKIYTSFGNSILNPLLRKNILPTFLLPLYTSMICGQTSELSGRPLALYRGISNNMYDNVQVGDIITDPGFSSYTVNPKIASSFTDNTIILLCHSGSALYLDYDLGTSLVQGEDELVLGPGLQIQIFAISPRTLFPTDGNIYVPMKIIGAKTIGYYSDVEPTSSFENKIRESLLSNNSPHTSLFDEFISGNFQNFYSDKNFLHFLISEAKNF